MKIGILSDTHDNLDRLRNAIDLFRGEQVEALLHAGDFVAPFVVPLLADLGQPVYGVFGNNDGERLGLLASFRKIGPLNQPPMPLILDKVRILLMHEPVLLEPLARSGEYDLIVYGHLHQPEARREEETLILNPGECCGWSSGRGQVVTLDLESPPLEPVFHDV
jgi:putative phosphoesterase